MGRELKRVALDFEWPIDKVWMGFLNPHYVHNHDCPVCNGSGSSPEARHLKDKWYGNAPFKPEDRGSKPFLPTDDAVRRFAERNISHAPEFYGRSQYAIECEAKRLAALFNRGWSHHLNADDVAALVEAGRLQDLTHTFDPAGGWKPKDPAYIPTPEEVNVWSIGGMGHDSINQWIVVGAECKRIGVPEQCSHCDGEGSFWSSPEAKQAADDWEQTEPPAGAGYQMWETVSEGSPISPVFATPEELAQWLTGKPWGADKGTRYEQWLSFINGPGWAPSLIMDASGMRTGVQAGFAINEPQPDPVSSPPLLLGENMNTEIKPRPAIAMDSVESSQIAAIGHSPETNVLAIQFKSKTGPGSVYHYENFTAEQFAELKKAESIGSHFYKAIKPFPDRFPYVKVG